MKWWTTSWILIFLFYTDIEYLWSTLKGIIDISIELYVPKVRCTSRKYPKWFNGEIRHHLHQLHSLRRKLHKSNNCSLYFSKVDILEDTLQGEIFTARSNYEAALVDEFAFSNDNAIYKHIRGLLNSNSLPNIVTFEGKSESTDKGRAHLFNSFFHSVFSPITEPLPSSSSLTQPALSLEDFSITIHDVFSALTSLDPSNTVKKGVCPTHFKVAHQWCANHYSVLCTLKAMAHCRMYKITNCSTR